MPTSRSGKPVVAISMGDPAGIGPEVILKSLASRPIISSADYILIGDSRVFAANAAILRLTGIPAQVIDLANVPVKNFAFGRISPSNGRASVEYIRKGYELIRDGKADCLVTAPISKYAVKKAGFKFPGHTEFLAALAGKKKYAMMFCAGTFRVTVVTRHIPLGAVPRHLTAGLVANAISLTLASLKRDFAISRPRIGVCGLNPHAGEYGIMGSEESRVIRPAIKKFKHENITGPIPADALFYDAYKGKFDCVIAHYHDQGLIPLKMVGRDCGVNITLGLGFVRTSPDHGTAFDIAGNGVAEPGSMEHAIRMAISMAANRKRHAE